MDINQATQKVEEFLASYVGHGGKKAKELRVRPSGDDQNEIKVWADLGSGVSDDVCEAWAAQCTKDAEASAAGFQLHVRAESL